MTTNKLVDGVPTLAPFKGSPCETCILAKHHKTRIPHISLSTTTQPLKLLHSDICGPMSVPSRTHARYILTLKDDYSWYTWVYPISNKSDVFPKFHHLKKAVESQFSLSISYLHSDQGGSTCQTYSTPFLTQMGFAANLLLPERRIKMES